MRRKKKGSITRVGLLAAFLIVAGIGFIGCSTDQTSTISGPAPELSKATLLEVNAVSLDEPVFSDINPDELFRLEPLTTGDSGPVFTSSETCVDGRSGSLNLTLDGEENELNIPRNATDGNVCITAEATTLTVNGQHVRFYDFGPDGTVFKRPVTLKLHTNLSRGEKLELWYWNPDKQKWEIQQSAKVKWNGVAVFYLFHFSKYAIS